MNNISNILKKKFNLRLDEGADHAKYSLLDKLMEEVAKKNSQLDLQKNQGTLDDKETAESKLDGLFVTSHKDFLDNKGKDFHGFPFSADFIDDDFMKKFLKEMKKYKLYKVSFYSYVDDDKMMFNDLAHFIYLMQQGGYNLTNISQQVDPDLKLTLQDYKDLNAKNSKAAETISADNLSLDPNKDKMIEFDFEIGK